MWVMTRWDMSEDTTDNSGVRFREPNNFMEMDGVQTGKHNNQVIGLATRKME